ncbi:MAG: TetR family transcriptional regulator [Verrucomicrobiota bacterium]
MSAQRRGSREAVERNPERTRQRILAAALREFAAKGFAGARVNVIARRARINKRMLYHYFGNKEALFREILRLKISTRKAWLASAPEHPFERLPYWSQLMAQDPQWIRLLQWEALQWGESRAVIDEERRRASFQQAVQALRQQQEAGKIPAQLDPGHLLISVLALAAYPFAFPQLARLATGLRVSSEAFRKGREKFLSQFAECLGQGTADKPSSPCTIDL